MNNLIDIELLKEKVISNDSAKCAVNTAEFCNTLNEVLENYSLHREMQPFIDKIIKVPKEKLWRKDICSNSFCLTEKYENDFFLTLLGTVSLGEVLTKYTTTKGLIRICASNKLTMTSLIGMNDSTECTYAIEHMKEKGFKWVLNNSEDMHIGISSFITSFTTKHDDLTMWRLYGEDAKGVAINFKVEDIPSDFYLAHVSYADKNGSHPKLSLLVEMTRILSDKCFFRFQSLYKWRYFFKPYAYGVENEVRLLYIADKLEKNSTWITTDSGVLTPIICFPIVDESESVEQNAKLYPLSICGVTMGPQFIEKEKNKETIKRMFNTRFGWVEKDFKVEYSDIQNYKNI